MRRNSILLALAFSSAACLGYAADGVRQVVLLSVATEKATVELAHTPLAVSPVVLEKEPYSEDFILTLSGEAQAQAIKENSRVRKDNARVLQEYDAMVRKLVVADNVDRAAKRKLAEEQLGGDPLGKCILHVSDLFGKSFPKTSPFVFCRPDADGIVPASDETLYVRILFSPHSVAPPVAPVPGVSNEPVSLKLPVMLKVESLAGDTLLFETFEQTAKFPNPDRVIGKNLEKALDGLVAEAVKKVFSVLDEKLN